jgi:hypothetical protein
MYLEAPYAFNDISITYIYIKSGNAHYSVQQRL